MLIQKARELFLLSLEANGRSPRTIGTYDQRLDYLFTFLGRCKLLEEITPEDMDAWAAALRHQIRYASHPTLGPEQRPLATATINSRLRDVKAFFNWCVRRGHLTRSPAAHLEERNKRANRQVKAMRRDDLHTMMGAARERAEQGQSRDLALLMFAADTGCRVGEIASLTLENLNLTKCEAWITGKTGGRHVDFSQETAQAIAAWLAQHPNKSHGYAWCSLRTGRPATTGNIYQMFRRLARETGVLGRFNPHALRHLVGQIWVDKTNLELARQKLGHADITTTAIYANQDRTRLKHFTTALHRELV